MRVIHNTSDIRPFIGSYITYIRDTHHKLILCKRLVGRDVSGNIAIMRQLVNEQTTSRLLNEDIRSWVHRVRNINDDNYYQHHNDTPVQYITKTAFNTYMHRAAIRKLLPDGWRFGIYLYLDDDIQTEIYVTTIHITFIDTYD